MSKKPYFYLARPTTNRAFCISIADKLIPNLTFRNDEDEVIEEIGINKAQPVIPPLRQRNSQVQLLETLEQKRKKSIGFIYDNDQVPKKTESALHRREDGGGGGPVHRRRRRFEPQKSEEDHLFNESYMVIEFNLNAEVETLNFIIDKIRGKSREGGAELLVKKEPLQE
jgi:hypothetical protein